MTKELSVKGIKSFVGNEGHGYNATLYADGKKVAFVIDDASGGQTQFQYEGKTREERAANEKIVTDFIKALPPQAIGADAPQWEKDLYPSGLREINLDIYIAGLVDNFEVAKRLKSLKKAYVLYRLNDCKEGEFYKTKHLNNPDSVKTRVLAAHPDAVFM